jgi:hypothetical protein
MPIIGMRGSLSSGGFGEFRRADAFTPYFGLGIGNPNSNNITIAKNNSLPTMATNSLSGSTTISGTSWSQTLRIGTVLASGNVVFSDYGYSTNGGVTFPSGNSYTRYTAGGIAPASGLNGSFAYNPATNSIGLFYGSTNKSGNVIVFFRHNVLTGASLSSATGGTAFSGSTIDQVLYSSAQDHFYVFHAGGSTQADRFVGSTGAYGGTTNINAIFNVFKMGVASNGRVLGFQLPAQTAQRDLVEFTSSTLDTSTVLGRVTGLTLGYSNARYMPMTYLPVNQKYGMVGFSGTSNTQIFLYSSAEATPYQFADRSINIGLTLDQIYTGNVFEDINGDIYVCIYGRYVLGKTVAYNSFTYRSIDGGASFTLTNLNTSTLGLTAIARNLQ